MVSLMKDSIALFNQMQNLLDLNPALRDTAEQKLKSLFHELEYIQQQEELPLRLRKIQELNNLHFFVDAYQRGYKWSSIQVEALLDDIYEFGTDKEKSDDYYCLQPIVIKKRQIDGQDYFELIDGQQRLTTIYIILSYLTKGSFFELRYETRKQSTQFLNKHIFQLANRSEATFDEYVEHDPELNNIDNYYFFNAYKTVQAWFKAKAQIALGIREEWINTLLDATKVIWYQAESQNNELDDKKQSIAIFQRINQGKIALTNAELLKALFLNALKAPKEGTSAETFKIRQSELANQWDMIEHTLQNPDFWAFVAPHQQTNIYTRIELLFDLISGKFIASKSLSYQQILQRKQEYYTFQYFVKELSNPDQTVTALWKKLQQGFYRLNEWFSDDESYHLIGFIIGQRIKSISELWTLADSQRGREEFQIKLKQIIAQHIRKCFGQTQSTDPKQPLIFEDLHYLDHNPSIISLILLLNLDLHRQQNTRFPFKSYYAEHTIWSLEHIHAQNSDMKDINLEHWYKEQQDLLAQTTAQDISSEQKAQISQALEVWNAVQTAETLKSYVELQQQYLQNVIEQRTHKLDNLCLLEKRDNSVLSNKGFYKKRKAVMDLQKIERRFIPIATQWAFAKYFNPDVEDFTIWNQKDRNAYRVALIQCWEYYQEHLFTTAASGEQA